MTFNAEMNRRLRAVFEARTGTLPPEDAVVVVTGGVTSFDETYDPYVTLTAYRADGRFIAEHDDDSADPVATLFTDLAAVPEV